jgi:hypothetical protein
VGEREGISANREKIAEKEKNIEDHPTEKIAGRREG